MRNAFLKLREGGNGWGAVLLPGILFGAYGVWISNVLGGDGYAYTWLPLPFLLCALPRNRAFFRSGLSVYLLCVTLFTFGALWWTHSGAFFMAAFFLAFALRRVAVFAAAPAPFRLVAGAFVFYLTFPFDFFARLFSHPIRLKLPMRAERGLAVLAALFIGTVFLLLFSFATPAIGVGARDFLKFAQNVFASLCDAKTAFVWSINFLLGAAFIGMTISNKLAKLRFSDIGIEGNGYDAFARRAALPTLWVCVAVFAVQNFFDARYVFSGGVLPQGAQGTYAQFAFDGAAALGVAACIAACLIPLLFARPQATERRLKVLGYIWIGQNLFVTFCALARLYFYTRAYDLTVLRVWAAGIFVVICAAFVLIAVKIARGKTNGWLARGVFVAGLTGWLLLAAANLENAVAAYNVSRIIDGTSRAPDIRYVFYRGDTALPSQIRLLDFLAKHPAHGAAATDETAAERGRTYVSASDILKYEGRIADRLKELQKSGRFSPQMRAILREVCADYPDWVKKFCPDLLPKS